jgi:hypothetical protein
MSKASSQDSSSNDSSRNATDLIDRYLQAVRFWVPKTNRQEDLLSELGEDLRSQFDDKETELGRPLDKAEMAAILKRCGSPMMVAARIGPQRHLIGPALFPIYGFVLKMVLLWIQVPLFVFIIGPVNLAYSGGDWGSAVLNTFGTLWSALFIAAGIITLVFAIIERTSAHLGAECNWNPLKLPPVRNQEHKPSLFKAVCELGFGWFGLIWLLLLPKYPFLILGPAAAFLKAGPILHTFYLPFVLLSVIGLARSGITLARPQWTWFPLLSQLLQSALMLILLNYMIEALTKAPGAYPFLVLRDGVVHDALRDSPKYFKIAAIVNVSILISVGATWLGVCIAAIAQTWAFLRYLRKRTSGVSGIASIGVR